MRLNRILEIGVVVQISYITDLTWDRFIYPRGTKNQRTIDAYIEALAIRAQFSPIKIQRVFNYIDAVATKQPRRP